MDIRDSLKQIKQIYMSDSAMRALIDFERVLDHCDIYAFDNWKLGELVSGPDISRYYVTCTFMWNNSLKPNLRFLDRLKPYGIRSRSYSDNMKIPVEIKDPGDFRDGSKKARLVQIEMQLVEIMIPKSLIQDIKQGSIELGGSDIDLSELQTSYDKELEKSAAVGKKI